jgi:hypothetical protein
MAIEYSIGNTAGFLKVTAKGKDENLQEVMDYGHAIVDAAVHHGVAKVLCDETELEYALGTMDIFESARYISEIAPKIARIAIACKPEQTYDAGFWETVAVNRGLRVKMFKTVADAEKWLQDE